MQKLSRLLNKLDIKISTLIIILIALLSGRYRPLFIHIFVALIHELGHIFAAISLKVKVDKLTILPFGFFAQISCLEHIHVVKEFLIVISGPLMYIVNLALLSLMFNHDLISYQLYQQGLTANNIIIIFNLLPIYPLDGSRIIAIVLSFFITYKTMKKISFILSIISLAFLVYIGYQSANIIVYCYLIFMQLYYVIHFKEFYLSFIISRMKKSQYKKAKLNKQNDYYRPYDNIFFKDGKFITENQYAISILKSRITRK